MGSLYVALKSQHFDEMQKNLHTYHNVQDFMCPFIVFLAQILRFYWLYFKYCEIATSNHQF